MKKKSIKVALLIMSLSTVITSCKKGEEDPFLSLKSRKNRLAGTWEITSYKTDVFIKGGFINKTLDLINDKANFNDGNGNYAIYKTNCKGELEFEKEGDFMIDFNLIGETEYNYSDGTVETYNDNETMNFEGDWKFNEKKTELEIDIEDDSDQELFYDFELEIIGLSKNKLHLKGIDTDGNNIEIEAEK